jgi:GMP synthase (glutamine-hydrolysing)
MTQSSKLCTAIRHVHFEDIGSFTRSLQEAGYEISYLEAPTDDLKPAQQADLTVFLGGPIGVYEEETYPFLKDELAIAQSRLEQKKPMLGLCLGSQVIARAAGAQVYPGDKGKEIGWKPLIPAENWQNSVIAPLCQDEAQVLHWHGDTFDLPSGASRLASTDLYANQIYSIGNHVLAFQCHPELDPNRIEHWLVGHAVEISNTEGTDPVTIREETKRYGDRLVKRGYEMISNWLRECRIE